MELRASTQEPSMSPDHDDKEISDDDDDDRNHKHRRREDAKLLQSLQDDITEPLCAKPYRRKTNLLHNRPGSHSNETLKNYNSNPDQKRPGFRGPSDMNQKIRVNQQYPVDSGFRGRESSLWSQPFPNPSWGPFGLVPGMPNGGLDMIHHPIGLQGAFRPPINPSLNMGHVRQRCRDFEEQGFCLRGDMCPMEHGVNRIVVEDVQSLSQFNLPVSLPIANLSIAPAGTGPSPAIITTINTSSNSKNPHGKNIKHVDSSSAVADFYDPDQPLWGHDSHTPAVPQSVNQHVTKKDSLLDPSPSGNHHGVPLNPSDDNNEAFISTVGSISTTSKAQGTIRNRTEGSPVKFMNNESGNGRMVRKPSQKAERTLFVNGIPQKDNKRETLISHFKRFGEVVDVYIPLNSERAFVQFNKREEAEAALMAPDAVMGNRFIKLWWANRDNIAVSNVSPYKRKDDVRSTLQNDVTAPVSGSVPVPVANGTKVPAPLQKKLEDMKEELRKKQEMLDQKRNDFRRKLDKLEKQATGVKGEVVPEQVAKKPKLGVLDDSGKTANTSSSGGDIILPSQPDDVAVNSRKVVDPKSSKTAVGLPVQESTRLKASVFPWGHVEIPVLTNRFKLDNRPTAFKIVPPLPDGLADVTVLKEHFSAYGDISKVQLDDIEPTESDADPNTSKPSAQTYFTTRHAAEKAFSNAKTWKGHNLQFTWLNSNSTKETPSPTSKKNPQEIPQTTSQKPSSSSDQESERMEGKEIVKEPEEGNNHSNLSKP